MHYGIDSAVEKTKLEDTTVDKPCNRFTCNRTLEKGTRKCRNVEKKQLLEIKIMLTKFNGMSELIKSEYML